MVPLFTLLVRACPLTSSTGWRKTKPHSLLRPPLLALQQFPMGNVNSTNKDTNSVAVFVSVFIAPAGGGDLPGLNFCSLKGTGDL